MLYPLLISIVQCKAESGKVRNVEDELPHILKCITCCRMQPNRTFIYSFGTFNWDATSNVVLYYFIKWKLADLFDRVRRKSCASSYHTQGEMAIDNLDMLSFENSRRQNFNITCTQTSILFLLYWTHLITILVLCTALSTTLKSCESSRLSEDGKNKYFWVREDAFSWVYFINCWYQSVLTSTIGSHLSKNSVMKHSSVPGVFWL